MKNITELVHVTMHDKKHKLSGLQSISTSVLDNKICQARRKDKNSICAHCYANTLAKCYTNLAKCLSRNTKILTSRLLTDDDIAKIDIFTELARIESFGDVQNVTQCINYINIIKANPNTRWGIWTKNFGLWFKAFHEVGKPENCTFVVSSPYVNIPINVDLFTEENRSYIDHVFTVYDKENYSKFATVENECKGLSCRKCRKCYEKGTSFHIAEEQR